MKKIFPSCSLIFLAFSCLQGNAEDLQSDLEIETQYCSDAELSQRMSGSSALENFGQWMLQYPSGTEEGGMINATVTEKMKNKYFSLYTDSEGKRYVRFSLDAADKGKSKNGSSVRSELRQRNEWRLSGKTSIEYTFFLTSTDFSTARFTVGQFLQKCDRKHSPLCRIEVENGKITAKVADYERDGKTKADGKQHSYSLGSISQKQEATIKIAVDNRVLYLYRDGEQCAMHVFHEKVESGYKNYYKVGIYYQNKDFPNIFSEVFIRDLKVTIQ